MPSQLILILILATICTQYSVGAVPFQKENNSTKPKNNSLTDLEGSFVMPAWQDTLIRSDVQLLPVLSQSGTNGYYPTRSDMELLGDRDYARNAGFQQEGPDGGMQRAMGIFPYQSVEQNFYNRNANAFRPMNRVLGFFTPQQSLTHETQAFPEATLSMDFNMWTLFTRAFEPDKAHVKMGPLAFDVLWIGVGTIWSDYKGPVVFPKDGEDGWLGYVEIGLRGYLRLTDMIYFSWAANLIYLPWSNEFGFQSTNGTFPQLGVEFSYQKRVNEWDVYFSNQFYGMPGINMFAQLNVRSFDQAGNYMFGTYGRVSQVGLYDNAGALFGNNATIQITRMLLDSNWRFWGDYMHGDFWNSFDFKNHSMRDTLSVALGYEGNAIPFAPKFSYTTSSMDGFKSFWHQLRALFTGRITENVSLQTMIGYLWTSGSAVSQDSILWSVSLTHQFSVKGMHGLTVGQNFIADSYSAESVLANYYTYFVRYQLARRITTSAFAQYSNGDQISSAFPTSATRSDFDTYLLGCAVDLRLRDFTTLTASTAFERMDGDSNFQRVDHWVHRLTLTQQVLSRLALNVTYQYEDRSSSSLNSSEHMIRFGLTRYF